MAAKLSSQIRSQRRCKRHRLHVLLIYIFFLPRCHLSKRLLDRLASRGEGREQRECASGDGTSHGGHDRPVAGCAAPLARWQGPDGDQGVGGRGRGRGRGGAPCRAWACGHRGRRRRVLAGGARRDRQDHQGRGAAAAVRWTS
jgi:hypothetical protein